MRLFPAFFHTDNTHVTVFGGGEEARRKVRLLTKTTFKITVVIDTEQARDVGAAQGAARESMRVEPHRREQREALDPRLLRRHRHREGTAHRVRKESDAIETERVDRISHEAHAVGEARAGAGADGRRAEARLIQPHEAHAAVEGGGEPAEVAHRAGQAVDRERRRARALLGVREGASLEARQTNGRVARRLGHAHEGAPRVRACMRLDGRSLTSRRPR